MNADESYFTPRVAVSSAISALVVYRVEEPGTGDSRIAGRIYDPSTSAVGSEISLINIPGRNEAPEVAVLANGSYAIAATTVTTAGEQVVSYRLISATGSNVLDATQLGSTIGDGENDLAPVVTALTGGGFVIAWTNTDSNETNVLAQRFDNDGVAQGAVIEVSNSILTDDNNNDAAVVALQDGGFIVFWTTMRSGS